MFILLHCSLWSLKNLVVVGKTQRGGVYEDRGSKRFPNFSNKVAKIRLWPRFRGLGVATIGGYSSWF